MDRSGAWEHKKEVLIALTQNLFLHNILQIGSFLRITRAILEGDTDAFFAVLEEILIALNRSNSARLVVVQEMRVEEMRRAQAGETSGFLTEHLSRILEALQSRILR